MNQAAQSGGRNLKIPPSINRKKKLHLKPVCDVFGYQDLGKSSLMLIERFVEAQQHVLESVIEELSTGKKLTHWTWFIFPQIQGLGESAMSVRYAIESSDEAAAITDCP